MISRELQKKFHLIEMASFEEWKKADARGREKICRRIGRWQGEEIIKEIKQQVENE